MVKRDRIKLGMQILRFLPYSIWFNFHYLPFHQAIKLPILLYKPHLLKCGGMIRINGSIKFGMIRLGFSKVSLYPNTGIIWENRGYIEFNGNTLMGNASALSVGKSGKLVLGNNFWATCSLKIACHRYIKFSNNVLVGWDCLFADSDFHTLQTRKGSTKGIGEIHIGDNNWFAMQSVCLKNAKTPSFCVCSARTLINMDFSQSQEKIMLSGNPAKIVKTDIYHDWINDKIEDNVLQCN